MNHCRKFWTPPISTMESYEDWRKKESVDIIQKANTTYKKILSECPGTILSKDIDQELQSFIKTRDDGKK